jgi:hypothetical protein
MSQRFRRLLFAIGLALLPAAPAGALDRFNSSGPPGEVIILSGGPALREWENLRPEQIRHDRWWGNFVRAARIRMEQIRAERGPTAPITWLVFRTGYELRSKEDNEDHISKVLSVQEKIQCRLIWFRNTDEVINYLNNGGEGISRATTKIAGFEYFGHSNKFCFMFDYSSDVYGGSGAWLHETDLKRIRSSAFTPNAYCQSWGCHTAESMSAAWKKATGLTLVGAYGKTDYSNGHLSGWKVQLAPGASWRRR